jgi:uncharacterized membrane protein
MRPWQFHYPPLTVYFMVGLALLVILAIVLIELKILSYAYERMGINRRYVFGLLILSLLGSYVNIPVGRLPNTQVVEAPREWNWGVEYEEVPVVEEPGTLIAINLGGAVIPVLLSFYLLFRNELYLESVIGVAVVTIIVHFLAKPVEGRGITVPIFIPPLAAAGVAILLSRRYAPPLAYIAGSLGTLLGADLLNLHRINELHAPIASIGGAGRFDAIFLTGIIAVLLA